MRRMFTGLCLGLLLLVGGGLLHEYLSGGPWMAYVYGNASTLEPVWQLGPFLTLDQCRQAAHAQLVDRGRWPGGDYECGYRCGSASGLCQETTR